MTQVYKTHYEVIGAGLDISKRHFAEVAAARDAHWHFAKSVGGVGYRPNGHGGLRSVFFSEVPTGWRKIGSDRGNVEAVPNRKTAEGRLLSKQIAELPNAPEPGDLASQLGYNPSILTLDPERGIIYFPIAIEITWPETRHFLRLPRTAIDGFQPDEEILREVRESEFMRIVEDHNAEARRQKAAIQ